MASESIKAVIWDMGGVILRTEDKQPRAALAAKHGMSYEEIDAAIFGSDSAEMAFAGEIDIESHWLAVRERFCLNETGLRSFKQEFWAGDFIDYSLIDYIASLRARRQTALLSNAWSDTRAKLESRKALSCFDTVVISAEIGLVKPDPRIFHYTLNLLDVRPAQAVFVDDFMVNVLAARKLGMLAVHFQGPEQAVAEVSRLLNAHE